MGKAFKTINHNFSRWATTNFSFHSWNLWWLFLVLVSAFSLFKKFSLNSSLCKYNLTKAILDLWRKRYITLLKINQIQIWLKFYLIIGGHIFLLWVKTLLHPTISILCITSYFNYMIIGVFLRYIKTYQGINYIPLTNGDSFCGLLGIMV